MRGTMPIIIFIGLALIIGLGIVIMQASVTSAAVEVNDTATEELPVAVYSITTILLGGVAAVMFIISAYFALRNFV